MKSIGTEQFAAERAALAILDACVGNCKECSRLAVDASFGTRAGYYCFRCTAAEGYLIRTNTLDGLRQETIDHLHFEMSASAWWNEWIEGEGQ